MNEQNSNALQKLMWKKKANPVQSSIRVVYSHCNFTLIDHTIHVIGDYTCIDYIKCNSKKSYKIANNENFADIYTDDMLSTAVYQPLSSLQVRHKRIPHNQISTLLATKPPVS